MKTLIRSINRSPLRCGFFTLAIALCWFALSPPLKAVDCPSDCDNSIGQTALGFTALAVNTGFNNTGVGQGALQNNTTGSFNVAIGGGALLSNTTGQQNMAVGAEALNHNLTGNFNMGIGFRALFMNTGGQNTAVGAAALRNNGNASENTAIGSTAMKENTTGEFNTAIGSTALGLNTTGNDNTAVGVSALSSNNASGNNAFGSNALGANVGAVAGDQNNAFGHNALASNVEGQQNSAFGDDALEFSTGTRNTAVGNEAGTAVTLGSNNVYLGDNAGSNFNHSDESNTMRLGSDTGFPGLDPQRTFIAGIVGTAQPTAGTVFDVSIQTAAGSNFQRLGIDTSSRRYKEEIKPMDKVSEAIFKLKPVTYRIKKEVNPAQPIAFGLIAEDVAKACPDLAAYWDGQPLGVHYKEVTVMLLNEFLKEHKKVEEQQASIADLKSTVALQQKEMQVLTAQLKEQAAQIQKVSAQLEAGEPAPKVVANK